MWHAPMSHMLPPTPPPPPHMEGRSNCESCIGFMHSCIWLIWHTPMSHILPSIPHPPPQSLEGRRLHLGICGVHADSNDVNGAGCEGSGTLCNTLRCIVLCILQHLTVAAHIDPSEVQPSLKAKTHLECVFVETNSCHYPPAALPLPFASATSYTIQHKSTTCKTWTILSRKTAADLGLQSSK